MDFRIFPRIDFIGGKKGSPQAPSSITTSTPSIVSESTGFIPYRIKRNTVANNFERDFATFLHVGRWDKSARKFLEEFFGERTWNHLYLPTIRERDKKGGRLKHEDLERIFPKNTDRTPAEIILDKKNISIGKGFQEKNKDTFIKLQDKPFHHWSEDDFEMLRTLFYHRIKIKYGVLNWMDRDKKEYCDGNLIILFEILFEDLQMRGYFHRNLKEILDQRKKMDMKETKKGGPTIIGAILGRIDRILPEYKSGLPRTLGDSLDR